EHWQVDRTAQAHEIVVDRLARRRPEIGCDREDAVGADRLRVARELHRILDCERADVDRHWNPAGDHFDRGFGEVLALGDGQIERLALVMRPGDGRRSRAHVKVEDLLERRKIDRVVVLERRDRALHHAAELVLHGKAPKKRGGLSHSGAPKTTGWDALRSFTRRLVWPLNDGKMKRRKSRSFSPVVREEASTHSHLILRSMVVALGATTPLEGWRHARSLWSSFE